MQKKNGYERWRWADKVPFKILATLAMKDGGEAKTSRLLWLAACKGMPTLMVPASPA